MTTGDTTINTGDGSSVGNVQPGGDFVAGGKTNININFINWTKISAEFINSLKNEWLIFFYCNFLPFYVEKS